MRNNRVTKLCNIAHKPHSLEQPRVRRIDIVPGKNGESEWNQQLCIFDEENIISRVHSLAHKATYLWSSLGAYYFVHLTTANDSESGGWFSRSAQRNGIHEQKNKQFLKLTNDKAEEEEFVKMRVRRRRRRLRSWHCYQARVRRLTTRGMKCAATHSAKNVVVIVAAVTREHPVCFLGEQQHWIWMGRSVGRPPPTEKSRGWVGGMQLFRLDPPASTGVSRDLWRAPLRYLDAPELEGALGLPAPSHAAPTPSVSRHPLPRCAAAAAAGRGWVVLRCALYSAAFSQAPPHFCERSRPLRARGWIFGSSQRAHWPPTAPWASCILGIWRRCHRRFLNAARARFVCASTVSQI